MNKTTTLHCTSINLAMRDGPEYTPAFPEDVLSRIEDRTDWEMMLCPTREYTRPDFQIIMMIWPLQHSGISRNLNSACGGLSPCSSGLRTTSSVSHPRQVISSVSSINIHVNLINKYRSPGNGQGLLQSWCRQLLSDFSDTSG